MGYGEAGQAIYNLLGFGGGELPPTCLGPEPQHADDEGQRGDVHKAIAAGSAYP